MPSPEATMDLDLTKADVAKLSAEQQETIARIALDRGRIERETLERASGYPGQMWVPLVLIVAGPFVARQISRMAGTPEMLTMVVTMLFVLAVVSAHSHWGATRRMDAMLRLMKEQAKELERLKGVRAPAVDGE
jgi:hypothetical protein